MPGGSPCTMSWEEVLATLGLEIYMDALKASGFESLVVLADLGHDDGLAILKELEVLPGHRHRILRACQGSTSAPAHGAKPKDM